jgi:hypothetical protein
MRRDKEREKDLRTEYKGGLHDIMHANELTK